MPYIALRYLPTSYFYIKSYIRRCQSQIVLLLLDCKAWFNWPRYPRADHTTSNETDTMVYVIVRVITFNWNRYKGEEVEFTSWFSSMIIEQSKAKPAHKDGPVAVFPTSMYARSGLNKNKNVLFERGGSTAGKQPPWLNTIAHNHAKYVSLCFDTVMFRTIFGIAYSLFRQVAEWGKLFLVPTSCGISQAM